jgi:hypothetical protein
VADVHYTVDGNLLGTGTTASEAKAEAMATLLDAYRCNWEFPEVRIANDGSAFVGREYVSGQVLYTRFTRDEDGKTRSCGSCQSRITIRNDSYTEVPVSLAKYMDHVAAQYNEVMP